MVKYWLFFVTIVVCSGNVYAQSCAEQQRQVKIQMDYAKQYNNQAEMDRLQNALRDIRLHCEENQQTRRITLQKNIEQRQAALDAAERSGDQEDIDYAKKRLKHEQDRLEGLEH
ncbi:DUF1090 domain-containing protein [Serratia proteamaculans]|uniref:DUF1090 domain-containing protein n=1 Tax=Serratia proteamaculans TaxID=28151 RepID=UPI0021789D58|nr:DUF1090 domain-containing protein [Serratia proteamaculans]CAI1173101.1 Protein of uncharacterised function (DUF1090) [Serratia proteamaculans]